jgi:Cleft lip and palate transmembrane protein 1 (CLPTM1)
MCPWCAALVKYLPPKRTPEKKSLLGQKSADQADSSGSEPAAASEPQSGQATSAAQPECAATEGDELDDAARSCGAMSTVADSSADGFPSAFAPDSITESSEEGASSTWLPHFKPNMTVSMVNEFGFHVSNRLPPAWAKSAEVFHELSLYNAIVHLDEFWLLEVRT